MIAYQADVKTFLENVKSGSIVKILEPLVKVMIEDEPESNEIRSWEQSLPFMAKVLDSPSIPHDAGIFLEYKVPGRSKRVDFIITGLDAEQKKSCRFNRIEAMATCQKCEYAKHGSNMVSKYQPVCFSS